MYIYEKFNAPKAAAPQMLFTAIPHRPTSYASLLAMGECNACCPLCQWTHGHTRTTQDALSSPTTWWDEGTVGGGKLYSQQLVKSHHKLPTLSSLATCSGPATNKNYLTTNQYAECQLRHLCVRTIVWLLCALITILSSTIRPIHTSSAAAL